MTIEIVSIKPKIIDTKYVSMQILIDYDIEFKECISVILKKKNVSRLDVELYVSKALQKVIEELDDNLQLPEEN